MSLNISVGAGFKTECESYEWYSAGVALKNVKTYIKFNDVDWTEVSDYVRQIDITGAVDNLTGLPGANALRVQFDNDDLRFSDLYAAGPYYGNLEPGKDVKIDVAITSETVTLFVGEVNHMGFQETRQAGTGIASIDVLDYTKNLQDKKFDKDYIYTDKKLFDSSDTANSLIHILLVTHGGFTNADIVSTGTISYSASYVTFREGESIWTAIQRVSIAGLVIYCGFRYDGKFVFESRLATGWTDPADEYEVVGNSFDVDLSKNLLSIIGNKVRVRGSNYILRDTSTILWELRKIKDVGGNAIYPNYCWETINNGDWYLCDYDTDPPRDYYAQYKIEGEELIYTSDHVMTQKLSGSTELVTTGTILDYSPRRGKFKLKNSSGSALYLMNLTITGKAVSRKTLRTLSEDEKSLRDLLKDKGLSDDDANYGRIYTAEEGVSIATYGQKDVVITSEMITSDEQAKKIGDYHLKYGRAPRHQFVVKDLPFLLFIQPGARIGLDLTDLGFDASTDMQRFKHRITPEGASTQITLVKALASWDPDDPILTIDGGDSSD